MTTSTAVQTTQAHFVQSWADPESRSPNVESWLPWLREGITGIEGSIARSSCLTCFFQGGEWKYGIRETSRIGVAQAED